MMKLFSLVHNENIKVFKRIRTWIMFGIMAFAVLLMAFLMHQGGQNQDWEQRAQDEIQRYEDQIEAINESMQQAENQDNSDQAQQVMPNAEEEISSIQGQIDRLESHLEEGKNPYERNVWTFMSDSTGLIALISLFVVIVAADIVASEFSWGTIKMLMIRPFTRGEILLSKFITVVLFQMIILALLFITSWLIGGMYFGFAPIDYESITFTNSGQMEAETVSIEILKIYGVEFIRLLVIASLAFMISTIMRSNTFAIGIGVFILLSGNIITGLLRQYEWGKYVLFPNLNLTQYIHNLSPPFEGMTLPFSIGVNAVYFVIFMVLTWYIFKKRDIAG
ncbi:ABC transporter permease subunit [Virgibacillus sp. MSP4-1]|uniref:ABC transporter permease subunit n=1 Tax=Virgibacillus sp. MSP4-1 TaxID=2700081 RepID=UPI0003A7DDF0|nr:DUF2705 family protein [Virgibacillus sp. MSP4-1]QHS21523.1 ABC transporter permease subunit [Virgibacillus sp. MSP4-1]